MCDSRVRLVYNGILVRKRVRSGQGFLKDAWPGEENLVAKLRL